MSTSHSDFIVPLIRSLRGEIMAAYGQVDHDLKEDKTVVTEIDRLVEQKLTERLSEKYPNIGFLGEELGQSGNKECYWLIDPIDGTESYVRGLPGVTSMLALVENGEITESYIYDLADDVMYSACKGMGAYADDKKIGVNSRPIERSVVALSSSVLATSPNVAPALTKSGVFYIGQYFGCGLKAIYMASGKIDAVLVYKGGGGQWDYAPTIFMMKEAGAVLTYFDEGGLDSKSHLLASPEINDVVSRVLKEEFNE